MAKRTLLAVLDPARALKSSRLRAGSFEARGIPAILIGVAAIVGIRGVTAALHKSAAILPETLREARQLWLTVRGARELPA